MVDLDRLEHILGTMEKNQSVSKEDEQYLAEAYEEIKALLAEEDYPFPNWMEKSFLGYVMGAMLGVFMHSHPREFIRAYLFFKRSQKEKENGRD